MDLYLQLPTKGQTNYIKLIMDYHLYIWYKIISEIYITAEKQLAYEALGKNNYRSMKDIGRYAHVCHLIIICYVTTYVTNKQINIYQ